MDFKLKKEIIELPIDINRKFHKVTFYIYESAKDINEWLAELFVQDDFIKIVFNKIFTNYDWEKLYYSIRNMLRESNTINNGVLTEHLSSYFLSKNLNLLSLLSFTDLNFEDPSGGIDIIFLNSLNSLELFEVKSSIKNDGLDYDTTYFLTSETEKSLYSLFNRKMRNVSKLVNAKEMVDKQGLKDVFKILSDMLRDDSSKLINFVSNDKISFNICLIGKEMKFCLDKFKNKLSEIINKHESEESFKKVKIFNLISLQFKGSLSMESFLKVVMEKSKIRGGIS